jgi:NAD(P)-dependent dehydrogenase (short-subunit alcohol dehydrogenase family)
MSKHQGPLAGQVALVTGAASGIGRAVSIELAARGAGTVLLDVDEERGRGAAISIEADGGSALYVRTDVADPASVQVAVTAGMERFERIDVVVNDAAVFTRAAIDELTFEDWRYVIGVNLDGTFHVVQAVLPHLVAQQRGKIFNFSSGLGVTGGRRAAAYATSKAAIIGFTKCLAHELAPLGISANVIIPGLTDTEMPRKDQSAEIFDAMVAQIPWGRPAQPEEVARFVALLADPACTYVTGQTLAVNGGWIMP